MKNTCSPLMLPAASHMSKIHNPGTVVRHLVGSRTTWWLPGALQLGWTLYHVAEHLLNPASKPTSISPPISLYLFTLAPAINQMTLKQHFKQIHVQMLCCPQYCSGSVIIMIDYYFVLFQSLCYTSLIGFDFFSPYTSVQALMGFSDNV